MLNKINFWASVALLSLCFAIASCGPSKDELDEKTDSIKTTIGVIETDFKVVIIDSCEYVYSHATTNAFVLTHKGNCKNHK